MFASLRWSLGQPAIRLRLRRLRLVNVASGEARWCPLAKSMEDGRRVAHGHHRPLPVAAFGAMTSSANAPCVLSLRGSPQSRMRQSQVAVGNRQGRWTACGVLSCAGAFGSLDLENRRKGAGATSWDGKMRRVRVGRRARWRQRVRLDRAAPAPFPPVSCLRYRPTPTVAGSPPALSRGFPRTLFLRSGVAFPPATPSRRGRQACDLPRATSASKAFVRPSRVALRTRR